MPKLAKTSFQDCFEGMVSPKWGTSTGAVRVNTFIVKASAANDTNATKQAAMKRDIKLRSKTFGLGGK